MTKLFVDSDGCPVREESIKVACRNNVETFLVCAGGIRPYENPLVQIIFVKEGLDSADDWIVENIGKFSRSIFHLSWIVQMHRKMKRKKYTI